jgi:hypothetical protein
MLSGTVFWKSQEQKKKKVDTELFDNIFFTQKKPIPLEIIGMILMCVREALFHLEIQPFVTFSDEACEELDTFVDLCNLYLSQLSELMTQSPHALPKLGYEHLTQTLPRGPEYARKVAQAVHSAIVALKIMLKFSDGHERPHEESEKN